VQKDENNLAKRLILASTFVFLHGPHKKLWFFLERLWEHAAELEDVYITFLFKIF
jgi:hypothetical protein